MLREDIADLIETSYGTYIHYVEHQVSDLWTYAPKGKWTVGQHTLHLLQSTTPLNFALSLPNFAIRFKYRVSNRPVRDFETVKKRYTERLKENQGKTYKASQDMEIPALSEKEYLLDRLRVEQKKLQYKTRRLSEKNLDTLVLPHPLMGKMPLRELLLWSTHHVDHHLDILKAHYTNDVLQLKT